MNETPQLRRHNNVEETTFDQARCYRWEWVEKPGKVVRIVILDRQAGELRHARDGGREAAEAVARKYPNGPPVEISSVVDGGVAPRNNASDMQLAGEMILL